MSELESFRHAKDAFFGHDAKSPLTVAQRRDFAGLSYFPENPDLRMEVSVARSGQDGSVQLQTSTGDVQTYSRLGRFHFSIDGTPAELTIFEGENGLFLPFADSLAGSDTYPAGRYLEPELLQGQDFLVDFNYAYNPYCAYNPQWSCPLTPFENRLGVPIRAGEMLFLPAH